MLQVDDVWRLFLMTVLFGWLAPLSYKWFKTKYHVGIHLHNFVAIMYVIDIVRRHTHPHNWFMNPPIVFLWLIDVRALKARGLKPATCSDPAPAPALPQNVTPHALPGSAPLFDLADALCAHVCSVPLPVSAFHYRALVEVPVAQDISHLTFARLHVTLLEPASDAGHDIAGVLLAPHRLGAV